MISSRMMRFIFKLFAITSLLIVFLIVLVTAYLLYIPLDLSNYKGYLIDRIEKETNVTVSVERLVLKILPNPRILLQGFEIRQGADTIFSSSTIRMGLGLMPLLNREINVKGIVLDSPILRVKRDKSGNINIREFLNKKSITAEIDIDDVRVINGRAWFVDEFTTDKVFYTMGGIAMRLKPDYYRDSIIYELKGSLHDDTALPVAIDSSGELKDYKKEVFSIMGKLTANNMTIHNYQPYLANIMKDAGIDANINMQARFSLKGWLNSVETNGKIDYSMLKLDASNIFSRKITSTRGSFDVDIKYDDAAFLVKVKNGVFHLPEFTVNASGTMERPKGKDGFDTAVDLKASPISLSIIKGYIPSNTLPSHAYQNLNKIDPKNGSVTIERLVYSSKKPDDFLLKMVVKDAGFLFAGFKRAFAGLDGNLLLRSKSLAFENIKARYGRSGIDRLAANISNLDSTNANSKSNPTFVLKTALAIDVKEVMDELRQRDFGRQWARTFGELKEIDGFSQLTLDASGSLKEKGQVSYSGQASIKNINLSHKDLTFPLNDLNGVLNFDEKKIALNNLAGRWGKTNFVLNGVISEYKETPLLNLNAKGFITEAVLHEIAPELKDTSFHFDNGMTFTGDIKGAEDNMTLALALNAEKSDVKYSTWFTKPLDYPFFMDGVLNIKRPSDRSLKRLLIDRLNMRFGGASIDVKGDVYKNKASFSIKTNDMNMDDVDNVLPYFKKEFKSSGIVGVNLKIIYDLKDSKKDINGEVRLKDAQFETGVLPKIVSKMDAVAKVSGSSINVDVSSFETGRTKLAGSINIPDISRQEVKFNVAAQYLDAEDLYPLQEKRRFIPIGTGSISAKKGGVLKLDIDSFRADVVMEKERVVLRSMLFKNNDGIVSGNITYFRDTGAENKPLFTANIRIDDWDAEKILKDIGAKERIISGRLNTSFELSAKQGAGDIMSRLHGSGKAQSMDGKLWRFVLMSKLFSIVNIISINELLMEGLYYNELKGNFVIKDGVLSTEDLFLDSSSMRMSAIGSINMAKRTVDAKLGVHPFVTVDSIVSKIPLAGWIIGGKEKSTLSMYYEVKGDLNNPNVEAVPVKSISTGILGIFQRILEAPLEAVKPLVK